MLGSDDHSRHPAHLCDSSQARDVVNVVNRVCREQESWWDSAPLSRRGDLHLVELNRAAAALVSSAAILLFISAHESCLYGGVAGGTNGARGASAGGRGVIIIPLTSVDPRKAPTTRATPRSGRLLSERRLLQNGFSLVKQSDGGGCESRPRYTSRRGGWGGGGGLCGDTIAFCPKHRD